MQTTLQFNYTTESSSDIENTVIIEQEEWSIYDGVMTNSSLANTLVDMLYSSAPTSDSTSIVVGVNGAVDLGVSCSTTDSSIDATLYVYPLPYNLNFVLNSTRGSLSITSESTDVFRELVQISLTSSGVDLEYPVKSLINMEWYGDVYNSDGDVVNKPLLYYKNNQIFSASSDVYGTVDIFYYVYKVTYNLHIPDVDILENYTNYCHVYAVFDGGVTYSAISKSYSSDTSSSCRGSSSVFVHDDDPYTPIVYPRNKTEVYDYCSNELIKESLS